MAQVYLPKGLYEELKRRFPKLKAAPGVSVWARQAEEVRDFPRRIVAMGDKRELKLETRPQLCLVSLRAFPGDPRFTSVLPQPVGLLVSRFLCARDVLAALLADGTLRAELPEDWGKGLDSTSSLRLFFSEGLFGTGALSCSCCLFGTRAFCSSSCCLFGTGAFSCRSRCLRHWSWRRCSACSGSTRCASCCG